MNTLRPRPADDSGAIRAPIKAAVEPVTVPDKIRRKGNTGIQWRPFVVLGLPLTIVLMSIQANRIVTGSGRDRIPPGTATSLFGRSKRDIRQEFGDPVLAKCAHFDWFRYTKDGIVVMIRYGESDTADRIVVTDLGAEIGAEGDSQCYPPFPSNVTGEAPAGKRTARL